MFNRILLSLDGAESSEIVIPYVVELARTFNASIDLVGVAEGENEAQANLLQKYLKDMEAKLESRDLRVSISHLRGRPESEILNFAAKNDSSLIAMAARGKTTSVKWPMGSVAEKVLRTTTKPLLLVSRGCSPYTGDDLPVLKKVLVPLDGSELGESALPYAIEICHKTGATLQVLHIISSAYKMTGGTGYALKLQHQLLEVLREEAKEYLEGIADRLKKENIGFKTETVTGYPSIAILEYSRTNNVDLIAISSHGQSGIDRFVMGSTTDKVIHNSEHPVLLIRVKPGKK
jgi:nucleotide-binding universal stress UspA family protein